MDDLKWVKYRVVIHEFVADNLTNVTATNDDLCIGIKWTADPRRVPAIGEVVEFTMRRAEA